MTNEEKIVKAKEIIDKSNNIMIFSGAGLSTESGIPDFRSEDGLYSHDFKGYDPEVVLSHAFYLNKPDLFWEYLRSEFNYVGIKPDDSYKIISKLEAKNKLSCVVTQNIDSLHKEAGNKNVIEVHGTLKKCYCDVCKTEYDYSKIINNEISYECKICNKGTIRPDVVLYDESVDKITDVIFKIEESDLLIVLGTSLKVYPIANLPQFFLNYNKPVIIINRDKTTYKNDDHVIEINDGIGKVLRELFPNIL